jgi:nucleoid DNA-binding protein
MSRVRTSQVLAEELDMSVKSVDDVLRALIIHAGKELRGKRKFSLPGYGTVRLHITRAHTRRNPRTGETVQVPTKEKILFTPSENFGELKAQGHKKE